MKKRLNNFAAYVTKIVAKAEIVLAWEVWNLESNAEREARLKKQRLESGFDFVMEQYHDRMSCYSLANNDYQQFEKLYYETEIDVYYELLAYRKALNWSPENG